MLSISSSGSFPKTESFLKNASKIDPTRILSRYGQMGVDALSRATPIDSRLTADSWGYRVVRDGKAYTLQWFNTHVVDGVPVPILLQYGHGTGTGGYVQGRDFINPAMKPILDKIAEEAWKAVSAL